MTAETDAPMANQDRSVLKSKHQRDGNEQRQKKRDSQNGNCQVERSDEHLFVAVFVIGMGSVVTPLARSCN
jgi:hypothetical protein